MVRLHNAHSPTYTPTHPCTHTFAPLRTPTQQYWQYPHTVAHLHGTNTQTHEHTNIQICLCGLHLSLFLLRLGELLEPALRPSCHCSLHCSLSRLTVISLQPVTEARHNLMHTYAILEKTFTGNEEDMPVNRAFFTQNL